MQAKSEKEREHFHFCFNRGHNRRLEFYWSLAWKGLDQGQWTYPDGERWVSLTVASSWDCPLKYRFASESDSGLLFVQLHIFIEIFFWDSV